MKWTLFIREMYQSVKAHPWIVLGFKLCISAAFLFILYRSESLSFGAITTLIFKRQDLLIAFLLITLSYEILSAKMLQFLTLLQGKKLDFLPCVKIVLLAHLFDLFLPSQGGGMAARAYYLKRSSSMKLTEAGAIIFYELYLLGTVALILLVLSLTLSFPRPYPVELWWILAGLLLVICSMTGVAFNSAKIKWLPALRNPLKCFFGFTLVGGFGILMKTLIFFVCSNYLLNHTIDYFPALSAFIFGAILTLIPTGPASVGGGHYFFQQTFNVFSSTNSNLGVELFNVLVFCHLCMAALGLVIYWLAPPRSLD